MSSSRSTRSSTSSTRSRQSARLLAQTTVDAKLHSDFEEQGDSFYYSQTVAANQNHPPPSSRSREEKKRSDGKLIQPFGSLLALDEKTFTVVAYSENAPEMLTTVSHAVPSVGDHPRWATAALRKALGFPEVSLLNPILVHCKTSGKPFYAIAHRVTGYLVVDFEPVRPLELPMTAAGALQSYKLAAKAISRLQQLPGGSLERLCDAMVREVAELTGYDRVMAYRFHEDDHGEVVAEVAGPGLEPYLGLHYPATDIPQASRFLFLKNKVRVICDCRAKPVRVKQDEKLPCELTLCGSTLRAPIAATRSTWRTWAPRREGVGEPGEKPAVGARCLPPRSPRFVPFPLRYACEFLAQVFAIHVNKELVLERQAREKSILRTQALLCDMLLRDAPRIACATRVPGAIELGEVVCGMASARINSGDILFWFRSHAAAEIRWGGAKHDPADRDDGDGGGKRMHPRSSFKAFLEVVKMRSSPWKDYEMDAIHSLQIILRGTVDGGGGAKNSPAERNVDGMVELRAVTNEMVRLIETATVPILAVDANGLINGWNHKIAQLTGLPVRQAIGKHLLTLVEESSADSVRKMLYLALQGEEEKEVEFQMKTHGDRREEGPVVLVVNACASRDLHESVVGVCFVAQDMTGQRMVMDRFTRIEGDYKAIVLNPSPLIPPIFAADEFGWCSEWNPAMARLSGWEREEVASLCQLKNQDAFVNLSIAINDAMAGQETRKVPFGFLNRGGKHVNCLLSVSKKADAQGAVTGIFCFLQTASQELQQVLHAQRLSEQTTAKSLKALTYIRHEIRSPLSGIDFSREMLQRTPLSDEQRQILATAASCQLQLDKILGDIDLDSITDSCLDLEMVEFSLREVLAAAVSQVMIASKAKGVEIAYDLTGESLSEILYGDRLRLQQIIADFLLVSVKFSRSGGQLEVAASLTKDRLGKSLHAVRMELRITHHGNGVPEELLAQMFGDADEASDDGVSLLVCRNLLRHMNGDVRYLREAAGSSIILSAELASAQKNQNLIHPPE
ncbi:unnamed protein product [Spirodela intermedia]|uniref:Uncharacterized protein n=1 Tax=Spirodela intermedia TaxID=51605 RepID=A0A7I8IW72_SPIIN|nr:unnamed protein product [Spirodela intermedia]CAA6662236.1 unnamed protein product [Spirodela intermedia]